MVDAQLAGEPAAQNVAPDIVVEAAEAAALARYRAFASERVKGAAQHPLWYETWLRETGEAGHIVWLEKGGLPSMALPLVEVRRRGLTALSFAGGPHANGNFCPAVDTGVELDAAVLSNAIRQALPHVALLSLERQHHVLAGRRNALSQLATGASTNVALAASLTGGFAGLLERANGKKKMKKRRAQLRRFEEAGGHAIERPIAAGDIDAVFEAYLAMKAARFAKAGLPDVFAPDHIRRFWRALLVASQSESDKPFTLEALVVGGAVCAVTGSSHQGDRDVCEFGAIGDGELTQISPGEYLAFSNLEAACAKGLPLYDFSVGDEAYKRSWCDLEIWHFDAILALTPAARLAALGGQLASSAKRTIKSHPRLWSFAKAVRRIR